MIMLCADTHEERFIMVQCIVDAVGDEAYMVQRVHNLFPILIGGRVENMSDDNMLKLWWQGTIYIICIREEQGSLKESANSPVKSNGHFGTS